MRMQVVSVCVCMFDLSKLQRNRFKWSIDGSRLMVDGCITHTHKSQRQEAVAAVTGETLDTERPKWGWKFSWPFIHSVKGRMFSQAMKVHTKKQVISGFLGEKSPATVQLLRPSCECDDRWVSMDQRRRSREGEREIWWWGRTGVKKRMQ